MSKRAEAAAMKAYPVKDYDKEPNYLHTCTTKMLDEVYREVFKLGYMQAEKDIAEFLAGMLVEVEKMPTDNHIMTAAKAGGAAMLENIIEFVNEL